MSNEEIIDGNELIAFFMGLDRQDKVGNWGTYGYPQWWRREPKEDGRKRPDFVGYPHQLKYNTSWDSLIPVAEKIYLMREVDNVVIGFGDCYIISIYGKFKSQDIPCNGIINDLFSVIIAFIKYYNTLNQNK